MLATSSNIMSSSFLSSQSVATFCSIVIFNIPFQDFKFISNPWVSKSLPSNSSKLSMSCHSIWPKHEASLLLNLSRSITLLLVHLVRLNQALIPPVRKWQWDQFFCKYDSTESGSNTTCQDPTLVIFFQLHDGGCGTTIHFFLTTLVSVDYAYFLYLVYFSTFLNIHSYTHWKHSINHLYLYYYST